jgi:hypothetical protein
MGKELGDLKDPLLVSVRSGAKFSMPGMMETVLDVGLTDASVAGLVARTGNPRFAWDSYRRLIQMFGKTVFGVPGEDFERALDAAKQAHGVTADTELDSAALRDLVEEYKKIFHAHTGRDFPQAPHEQLFLAIRAVFESWNAERAVVYRRQERIPTWAPPSTSSRWCTATWAPVRGPASRSPVTRPPARAGSTATTWRMPRARTSSPASATPCPCRTWPSWTGAASRS